MSNSQELHAFPRPGAMPDIYSGMTLRDYFAAQALPNCISLCQSRDGFWDEVSVAAAAYALADAMIQARVAAPGESERSYHTSGNSIEQDLRVYASLGAEPTHQLCQIAAEQIATLSLRLSQAAAQVEELTRCATFLWDRLDDIDTVSDMVKGDHEAYRMHAERIQRRRFEVGKVDAAGRSVEFSSTMRHPGCQGADAVCHHPACACAIPSPDSKREVKS